MNIKNAAIILAGGNGSRYGADTPKQFTRINGRMVLDYSVGSFLDSADLIVLAVGAGYVSEMQSHFNNSKIIICEGGGSRQESVYKALLFLEDYNPSIVAVHDGARMLVTAKMINEGFKTAAEKGSAVPVIPLSDALWDKDMSKAYDRSDFVLSQTPQVFNYRQLLEAHQNAEPYLKNYNDCAGIYAKSFKNIYIYEGDKKNIKLTTPEDRELIKAILSINKS